MKTRSLLSLLGVSVALTNLPMTAPAAYAAEQNLMELTLDELMNEPVTSVSKRATRLGDAATAVAIITAEDIRRLGITTLPDALRLVPGMEVSRINSHLWAVSARGFQGQLSDKLLVMIDGRTVYEPMFAGVHWGSQDIMLEDVERIEVIRGPGATLWGANAVNGVVNILSKSAAQTHGVLTSASLGFEERAGVAMRYGDVTRAGVDYRIYAKYFDRDGLVTSSGADAQDDWHAIRSGLRMDWDSTEVDSFTVQGEMYRNRITESGTLAPYNAALGGSFLSTNTSVGANALGRWTHAYSESSALTVQSFYTRSQYFISEYELCSDSFDFDVQHTFSLGARQQLIWGAGYRVISDYHRNGATRIVPHADTMKLATALLQDEIALVPERVHLTIGTKLERNEQTGFEAQPSVRVAWTPGPAFTLWGAVSRAVRTPDRFERGSESTFASYPADEFSPAVRVRLIGNDALQAEELVAYELGFRVEPDARLSFDLAAYYNDYSRLITFASTTVRLETGSQPLISVDRQAANASTAHGYGAEISARWNVSDRWRLAADYNWMRFRFPDGADEFASPEQQAHVRSFVTLPWNLELNSALSFTDRLTNSGIDAYLNLDLGVIWHPSSTLEVGVWGNNLLDRRHLEFEALTSDVRTEVARTATMKVTKRF